MATREREAGHTDKVLFRKASSTNVSAHLSGQRREHAFELTGGSLALDFANTLDDRRRKRPREHIRDFADLLSWGRQAGAVNSAQATLLLRTASRNASTAQTTLRRALVLREAIYRIFSAAAQRRAVPQSDLVLLNAAVGNAFRHLRVASAAPAAHKKRAGSAFAWDWNEDHSLDRILSPLVRSAVQVL